jgi:hypothetical protein
MSKGVIAILWSYIEDKNGKEDVLLLVKIKYYVHVKVYSTMCICNPPT